MKNCFKTRIVSVFGIIALVAVIGFSTIACGGDDGGGGVSAKVFAGTWNGTYEDDSYNEINGSITVTVSDMTVSITGTNSIPSTTMTLVKVDDVTSSYKIFFESMIPGAKVDKIIVGLTKGGDFTFATHDEYIMYVTGSVNGKSMKSVDVYKNGWGSFETD